MTRFQEALAGMQELREAVAVQTMMAFHWRELVAAAAAVEMRMQVSQLMVAAAPAVVAMETAAVVVVVALMAVLRVEPEA